MKQQLKPLTKQRRLLLVRVSRGAEDRLIEPLKRKRWHRLAHLIAPPILSATQNRVGACGLRQAMFCGKTRRGESGVVELRERAITLDCRRGVNFMGA